METINKLKSEWSPPKDNHILVHSHLISRVDSGSQPFWSQNTLYKELLIMWVTSSDSYCARNLN